jgi:hypothetical protein
MALHRRGYIWSVNRRECIVAELYPLWIIRLGSRAVRVTGPHYGLVRSDSVMFPLIVIAVYCGLVQTGT